jgi:hypothetical protein
VRELEDAVQAAVAQGGPEATAALMAGRAATRAKHSAADVLDQLRDEPVQVFQQATWQKDAGIDRLREIGRLAPQELPKIGRAYLDDLLQQATAAGGFQKAQGLWSKWQNLGPQTKRLLFGHDTGLVSDLDRFFLLAKKAAENPNPSGTGYVVSLGAQGGLLITEPVTGAIAQISTAGLSKLLHSRRGVQALTRGLSVKLENKATAAAAVSSLLRLAGDDARPAGGSQ